VRRNLKRSLLWAIAFGLLAAFAPATLAQNVDAAKAKDIRRLLELSNAIESGLQVVSLEIEQTKKQFPNAPEKFWDEMEDEIKKEFRSESFFNEIVAIYDRHLTAEDVRGLVAFYETPLGQKTLRVMPLLKAEAQKVGEQRGEQLADRVIQKLRAEGAFDPPAPKPIPFPPPAPRAPESKP
jgi:uncharacterized protein